MDDEQQERVRRVINALILMVQSTHLSPKEAEVALLSAYRVWLFRCGLTDEQIVERATLGLTLLAVPIGAVPA